ncbi:MAG TPA: ABC transporter permease [Longimicrobiales bacterium]|nr:ABC transporter permease [Longimicrobiales bacterium]
MATVVSAGEARPGIARATAVPVGDRLLVVLSGEWQLDREVPCLEPLMDGVATRGARDTGELRVVGFDATELAAWDSSLLIFLLKAADYCSVHELELDTSGLPERIARLLALARAVPERAVAADEPRSARVARLGQVTLSAWQATVAAVTFTGEVATGVGRLLLGRARMRWRDFWVVVQSNSSGALPIVTLIALLVGVIIAFLGVVVLRRFGAGYYVSYLVGYGMLREMGALMTGIIMAGRTGAGFAAELGSMKITEEIDAYSTLGVSPIEHLAVPRILGLFVMMPLLVIYADAVGLTGGMIVAVTLLDLTPTQFISGLLTAVTLPDALLGVVKATIFGLIIGLAGCMKGMQTGTDAGAVGRSATSAVVLGITLIILANTVIDWLAALLQI